MLLRLLLSILQTEDVVRLQMLLLNHLLRVVADVVVMREGPSLLLLLLLLMLHLVLQLLLVTLGPRRVPLTAADADAATAIPLVPVVGVDIPRVPRLLMWGPVKITVIINQLPHNQTKHEGRLMNLDAPCPLLSPRPKLPYHILGTNRRYRRPRRLLLMPSSSSAAAAAILRGRRDASLEADRARARGRRWGC